MPALPAVSKVLRVAVKGQIGDDTDVINRFFLQYTGTPPTDADLNTFCANALIDWGTFISPLQGSFYSTTECSASDLSSSTSAEGTALGANGGTRGGTGPAPATCVVIQHRVARRYRGGHCRTYLYAGIDMDHPGQQVWTSAFQAAVATAWAGFMSALELRNWTGSTITGQVNVSYYSGFTNHTYPSGRTRAVPTLRSVPQVDVIASHSVNPHIGSQRRRNR